MSKITNADAKLINTVKRAFKANGEMSFSHLLQVTRLDSISLTSALVLVRAEEENGFYYLPNDKPENPSITDEKMPIPEETEKLIKPKKPRTRPFTPNPIMGYQVQANKAKIFLDRKASSHTLTLSLKDLKELVNAVEKSERVA